MTERRGRFITFEGPDGSGKSTQMRLLAGRLASLGLEVVETQEPGGTEIGRQIRRILLDADNHHLCPVAELLLYFAARSQNVDEVIRPACERGAIVLSDRFTDSTLAYQGAGRGIDETVVLQLHEIACRGVEPDLTVCIDIDAEHGLARVRERNRNHRDRMDEQEISFHQRVRARYLELAARNPDRIRIVDGSGTIAEVSEQIWATVAPVVAYV
jgi:dTMP kinase